jgi:CheY-specific phosphatase CheX
MESTTTMMEADRFPIDPRTYEALFSPFLCAIDTALREMASVNPIVVASYRTSSMQFQGDVGVVIDLRSSAEALLAFEVSTDTAKALAQRVLIGAAAEPDEALVRDSLGEILNVAAGQAKALLHGGEFQFTFGTPRIASSDDARQPGLARRLVCVMTTEVGDIIVSLIVNEPR